MPKARAKGQAHGFPGAQTGGLRNGPDLRDDGDVQSSSSQYVRGPSLGAAFSVSWVPGQWSFPATRARTARACREAVRRAVTASSGENQHPLSPVSGGKRH
jgi:hypothetical protein